MVSLKTTRTTRAPGHTPAPLRDREAAERWGLPPYRTPEWTKNLTVHPRQYAVKP
jgi:hypothetical protein